VDPRGRETEALAAAGGLSRLTAATGVEFPTIVAARDNTNVELAGRREAMREAQRDEDVAVVLMGSWGRLEVTGGSDNDFMCLVDGERRPEEEVHPTVEEAWEGMGRPGKLPGETDLFGVPVFSAELRTIGLEDDGNKNLTRRMLLLLESRWVQGERVFHEVKRNVLEDYLRDLDKDCHPPRSLLNDVFRYWRTIAVDFERKHRDRAGEEWGLRNAKLRTSRPLLFASGLLPVLECRRLPADELPPFLAEQFDATPIDRIAACFLRHGRADSGVRTLLAYDAFLAILEDEKARAELESLAHRERDSSGVYLEAKRLGFQIREGLLSLMFETPDLYAMVREYAIF
jgi:hypothetical protein